MLTNAADLLRNGSAKLQAMDYLGAISDFDQAIKLDPFDPEAYYDRGSAKGLLQDFAAAIEDYNIAIRMKADYAKAYYTRGLLKMQTGDISGGRADLKMAADLGSPEGLLAYESTRG
jgi:tetratricopeptide (TPR) repeat protein